MFNRVRTSLHRSRQACLRAAAIALAGLATGTAAQAQAIFQIDDAAGEIHLSDRADADVGIVVRRVAGGAPDAAHAPARPGAPRPFADIVQSAAIAARLSPALIDAVIAVESAYRVHAVSARGASGLMQLMPATARLYGVTDIFDPRQNIVAGAHHLRGLLDRYGQDPARALAAYNAGAGAVDRAALRRAAWPAETVAFVPNVLGRYAAQGSPPASAGDAH